MDEATRQTETKFTPGPWEISFEFNRDVEDGKRCSITGGEFFLAEIWEDIKGGRDVADANARLIAAAPDAHEVISDLLAFDDDLGSPAWNDMLAKARAYLRKVEGGVA